MIKTDIYESFNARYLSYEDIAKTFIVNTQFEQLQSNSHTLLMGPRGSGKTTLLKMLTPLCHHYFNKYNNLDTKLNFVAIYVPTDIQWQRQIEIFYGDSFYPKAIKENFPKFLVTTNILICIINTFAQLLDVKSGFISTHETLLNESLICTSLIECWDLEKPILPTFDSIKQSLYKRLKSGNVLLKKIRYEQNFVIETLPSYFYEDYFDLIISGCSAFSEIFKEYNSVKWALCFDELEISPDWLQHELIQKFRSTDQRFILKLTTSPLVSIVDKLSNKTLTIEAREDEDFRVIRTWNYNIKGQREWNAFGERLLKQKFQRFFDEQISPKDVLGDDSEVRNLVKVFPRPRMNKKSFESFYEKDNYYWLLFRELAKKDASFISFLKKKNIDPNNPLPNTPEQMDQVFRKVLQIVLFRYHFTKDNDKIRGRKNPGLYYGIPTIYELCDGNPRFLIGLIDNLLIHLLNKESQYKISINQQSSTISDFSRKYLDLISSHPDSNKEIYPNKYLNLGTLLKEIGRYFSARMLKDSFKMDVYSTFLIDDEVPQKIVELIELGVHLGAFIYLDPKKVVSTEGLRGKKLRISYLLHPIFNLPKREYNTVRLSTILINGKKDHISEQLTFSL
jgi:energy-coupling factor transporter ATP-binding protein EcfA2